MIFYSIEFLIFFAAVFSLYYFVLNEKTRLQNVFLLVASYVFYAWINWKILPLLAVTTAVFYSLGIAAFEAKTEKRKSLFTTLGVVFGIGALLCFKYFNFFTSSFKDLFELFGLQTNLHSFKIIVPIGISFYTFRLLSYIIDINRDKIEPTRDIIAFATYVAFFPCILAGPIDRPATLIPQLQSKRVFDYSLAVDGMRQILWGLFKKIVIADNCAILADLIFAQSADHSGSTLVLGAIFYSFQLYADFSGYSDMAMGTAKLLGFRVTNNFDYPFFAQNMAEFWRKWHISLTSWLTDYVFMPLNIKWRDWGNWGTILSIMTTFTLIGLWHGDNWTFVSFGLYHGLLYIPLILSGAMFKQNRIETYKWGFPKPRVLFNILLTFGLWAFGMVLFRAENMGHALSYISSIFSKSLFMIPEFSSMSKALTTIILVVIFVLIEWSGRRDKYAIESFLAKSTVPVRWGFYTFILLTVVLFFGKEQQFIYFQF